MKFELGELGPDGKEGHSGAWVVSVDITVGGTGVGSDGDDKGALESLSSGTLSYSTKSYTHTRAPSSPFPTEPLFSGADELLTPPLFSCHSSIHVFSLSPLG